MKKYITVALVLVSSVACKESFIQLDPIVNGSTSTFYKTASDLTLAVNAAYGTLQSNGMYNTEFLYGDVTTDISFAPGSSCVGGACDFDRFQMRATGSAASTTINNRWNDAYRGISRCNTILEKIADVPADATLKARLTAEAKFLRAMYYFTLVRTFGDVPLVLKTLPTVEEGYTYGREKSTEVYAQIVKDLTEASTALPATYTGNDIGRATKGAALGMLGKVYLTQQKYAEAATALKTVIDANTYSLLPNYADVFRVDNGNNAEIVFAVQYVRGGIGEGAPFASQFAPEASAGFVLAVSGNGNNQPTSDILTSFETGDLRRAVSVADNWTNGRGQVQNFPYTRKFLDPAMTAANDASNDWIVLRYADVLLMYSEALNETGKTIDALTYLNQVRKRAGLAAKTGLTQADFRLAVEQERKVELCFEGHRWWDLVRTGRAQKVLNDYFVKSNTKIGAEFVSVKDFMTVFPVPQPQIDANPSKITQNQGY